MIYFIERRENCFVMVDAENAIGIDLHQWNNS